jgi:dihydroneopterin aldolase
MTLAPGGWLHLEGIEVECTIGVTERERATKQRLLVNLKLKVDFSRVALSDAIQDTVDYRLVARRVVAEVEKSGVQLIETLAAHLGRTILAEYADVQTAAVEVWKPGALSAAKTVGAATVVCRS